ncbi:two-component system OmpR family response regulator [Sphingomonas sp. BK036]|uniref:winged helix-turn-helix domain-containing protein n=1 Tax=Sphingomonas sp. BK036 TaxID=2512122 RepID=UPI0010296284|nr:response regulator transcription factor [Sphingomonas sp. BK036]RZT46374.1 two-component system OmpR family response regulator [Sphingomonas sp. BK036]
MKLLLIEDDAQTADFVRRGLVELGHVSDYAATGIDGLTAAIVGRYDAIILDRNLPELDGLSVLKALRAKGDRTPVLLLSALGQVDDRIAGLQAGSDDYLAKPFSFGELVARLEAIVRRHRDPDTTQGTRQTGSLTLDLLGRTAMRKGRRIELLNKEYQLLDYLTRHAGQVVTRTMLIEAIWDYNFDPGTNVVDVHVSRLRAKIDGPDDSPMIRTVRGSGYRLDAV